METLKTIADIHYFVEDMCINSLGKITPSNVKITITVTDEEFKDIVEPFSQSRFNSVSENVLELTYNGAGFPVTIRPESKASVGGFDRVLEIMNSSHHSKGYLQQQQHQEA